MKVLHQKNLTYIKKSLWYNVRFTILLYSKFNLYSYSRKKILPKKEDQKSKEGTEETLIKADVAEDTKVSKLLFSLLLL